MHRNDETKAFRRVSLQNEFVSAKFHISIIKALLCPRYSFCNYYLFMFAVLPVCIRMFGYACQFLCITVLAWCLAVYRWLYMVPAVSTHVPPSDPKKLYRLQPNTGEPSKQQQYNVVKKQWRG